MESGRACVTLDTLCIGARRKKERKKETDRQTGRQAGRERERERSGEHVEASSRENHFELHSGEAIPSTTRDATETIAYGVVLALPGRAAPPDGRSTAIAPPD